MWLTRRELPIALFSAVYILAFSAIALRGRNYEFLLYAVVVIVVAAWILHKQHSVRFPTEILWGLSIWGLLHMAGGNVAIGDGERVLYDLQLIPVVLRYDQFVHAFGFGVAALVCHHVLRSYLRPEVDRWWPLAILVVLMGSGIGAINEIIEFVAVETMPETNVGGYRNTLLDLIFNLIGGLLAVVWLTVRRRALRIPRAQASR